jgi:tetratricopeptide (TPR) repeat protein
LEEFDKQIVRAQRMYQLKRYKEAIGFAKKALAIDIFNVHAYQTIILAYTVLRDYEKAKEYGEIASKYNPNSPEILHARGLAVYQM